MLNFNNTTLIPQFSKVASRRIVSLAPTDQHDFYSLSIPIMSSNMVTVTGGNMVRALTRAGGVGLLNRDDFFNEATELAKSGENFIYTMSTTNEAFDKVTGLLENDAFPDAIMIDVAHADSANIHQSFVRLLELCYNHHVSVGIGNIATGEALRRIVNVVRTNPHAYDGSTTIYVRIGIAGGAVCSTKNVTGVHVPTLQSVYDVALELERLKREEEGFGDEATKIARNIVLIADGGITTAGDAVKCLLLGAHYVCLGSLLAHTSEIPPAFITQGVDLYYVNTKHFGMSSKAAREFYGLNTQGIAEEGVEDIRFHRKDLIPSTVETLEEFAAGMRSSLSYLGFGSLEELEETPLCQRRLMLGELS